VQLDTTAFSCSLAAGTLATASQALEQQFLMALVLFELQISRAPHIASCSLLLQLGVTFVGASVLAGAPRLGLGF
jgi:hypothetical protein